jgi:hypothetical protein
LLIVSLAACGGEESSEQEQTAGSSAFNTAAEATTGESIQETAEEIAGDAAKEIVGDAAGVIAGEAAEAVAEDMVGDIAGEVEGLIPDEAEALIPEDAIDAIAEEAEKLLTAETPVPEQSGEEAAPPEAEDNSELAAAFAEATAAALAIEETRVAAEQTRVFEDFEAEAALMPIKSELALLGIDPNQGELGFTHPPISLVVNDPDESDFANRNALTVARDFVMAADVSWQSNFTESGCGFAVRSDGNEESPSLYLISLTPNQGGHVIFAEQIAGEIDASSSTDINAAGSDPLFQNEPGAKNRLLVVGRGQEFSIYSNGTKLRTVTGKAGLEEGFVAFIAVNRSGGIQCDFDNAWLWKLN